VAGGFVHFKEDELLAPFNILLWNLVL